MEIFQNKIFRAKIASAPGGQFFAVEKSKNWAYCRVYHFKVFHLQWFFSLPKFKLVLKRCKGHNFEPSKQLIFNKYFSIYTHFAVGGKGIKNAYFYPGTEQNPHFFLTKYQFGPMKWMFKNRKHKNILWFQRFMSTADRRNMPIFCYDCLQYTKGDLIAKPH